LQGPVYLTRIPDDAKRFADIVNGNLVAFPAWELRNKWLAIRLSDGGSDGTIYDSKQDAVKHQIDEFQCAYFCFRNCLGGISAREAERFLVYVRAAYKAGFRLPDPDAKHGGLDTFISVEQFDGITGRNGRAVKPNHN
jgi:hypothetical protein